MLDSFISACVGGGENILWCTHTEVRGKLVAQLSPPTSQSRGWNLCHQPVWPAPLPLAISVTMVFRCPFYFLCGFRPLVPLIFSLLVLCGLKMSTPLLTKILEA